MVRVRALYGAVSRGTERLVFRGHEHRMPFEVAESFEDMDEYALE